MPDTLSHASLLLEIGVEELPSSFVDAALAALPPLVEARLGELRLTHGAVKALGTPRRLSFIVEKVAGAQLDLDEEVTGPPESAAFKDGKPTKAAEAFAAKLGIPLDALTIVDKPAAGKQKAGRYVVGRRVEKGKPTRELIGKALADVCAAIPFKKSMRWGGGDVAFGRPVQWLVALYGTHLVDVGFAGVRSTAKSRGHRFLSPEVFVVKSAETYVDQLRHHHVLVDRDERARVMMERVTAAAKAAGGHHDPEPSLIDENASLIEEPHVVTGSFEPVFLALPAVVIRAVARGHQKYFCVQKSEDELLPHYLTVANTANDPAKVAKGNDRVMRARLADARFFFEEDKKAKLEERVEKLAGIVFHNRLGTVREKVHRIERIARVIAGELGMKPDEVALVVRAAHLCKSDLVSLMVGEFPELQGHMGRAYAQNAGEHEDVADAIRDHYRPVGASDAIATSDVSACVALADRIDTLTGCFAVGLSPTGAADPFALRRACIGILRTLLDIGVAQARYARLTPAELVGVAFDAYEGGKKLDLSREDTIGKVELFVAERLRGLLASATSNVVADAVMDGHNHVGGARRSATQYPVYTLMKARALQQIVDEKQPWLEKARTVGKRLSGISKDAAPVLHPRATFSKPDDSAIVDVVQQVDAATKQLTEESIVRSALAKTEELAKRIDDIFLRTLVNDPNDPITPKRLELLSYGAQCMLRIADFSRLG
jgi:glycyl-tRNA synthetase beta chain